jgi:outer membrane protein OmpA-like peptidoglycan-associated protein
VGDTLSLAFNYIPDKIKAIQQNPDFQFTATIKEDESFSEKLKKEPIADIQVFDQIKTTSPVMADTSEIEILEDRFAEIEKEFDQLVFPDIKFVFDKDEIVKGTDKELRNVIQFMKKNTQNIIIEIAGHTDEKGSERYNIRLSQKRAEKVKEMMIKKGN